MEETEGLVDRVRRNFGVKTTQEEKEKQIAEKAIKIFDFASKARGSVELDWFLNDNHYKGEQQLKFNPELQALENDPDSKENSRITVAKAKQLVRGITSYINKEHPGIGIAPGLQSAESYSRSKRVKALCDSWYEHQQMNATNKKVTMHGVRYGVGWRKILWDKNIDFHTKTFETSRGKQQTLKGDVTDDWCNSWDVYPDLFAETKEKMRFIVHAIPRTLNELQNSNLYNNVDLVADDKKAASTFRQAQLAAYGDDKGGGLQSADPGLRTVIVLETYVKEVVEGKTQIRLIVTTQTGILLRDEVWPMDEFPFEYYQTDIAENVFDSVGSIKDNRPLYDALNRGASQTEEHSQIMARLNWAIEKGSGVNVINDKTGQFLEYNRGFSPPMQTKPGQLPQYFENHMGNLERWADDIGGAHQAFYGRSPFSRASGEAIGKMQDGDSNNLSMMRDNMDDHLSRTFKLMLKTYKQFAPKDIKRSVEKTDFDPLGQHAWLEVGPEDINLKDEIRIRTGTNMPFDTGARQEMVISLYEKGLFNGTPQAKAALKLMGLEDVENILGNDQLDIERQVKENQDLVEGKEVDDPVIAENHGVHIEVIDALIKSPAYLELKPEVKKRILDHRRIHAKLQSQAALSAAATNMEPIKRSMNVMYAPKNMNELSPIERTQLLSKVGIESDQAEIQMRGGLNVQDDVAAQKQADMENDLMMEGEPAKISLTDNHKVHLQVHELLQESNLWEGLAESHKRRIQEHCKQHEQAMLAQEPGPGLVGNSETDIPIPDHTVRTAEEKARAAMAAVPPEE